MYRGLPGAQLGRLRRGIVQAQTWASSALVKNDYVYILVTAMNSRLLSSHLYVLLDSQERMWQSCF